MTNIYTIGFTGKKGRAREFFKILNDNHVTMLIDVRLHNTSQLDGYSHTLDLAYMCELNGIKYINDKKFAPKEVTLKKWQAFVDGKDCYTERKTGRSYPSIDWDEYEMEFDDWMAEQDISDYIESRYSDAFRDEVICLQCTEPTAEHCHRRLIANYFRSVFEEKYGDKIAIIHL